MKHNLPGKYVHGTFHDQQLIYSVSWHPPCHNYIGRMISSHKARLKKWWYYIWKAYPVYASTATIAFVPDGNSSIQYLLYVAVRTIGVWGVYRASKTVEKVSNYFQELVQIGQKSHTHVSLCITKLRNRQYHNESERWLIILQGAEGICQI